MEFNLLVISLAFCTGILLLINWFLDSITSS